MANLWEKVKQTLEQSAKTIKESAESAAKTVAEKAPQVASTLVEKGQDFADTIGDKAQELVSVGQLKVKHYNLNRDVSNLFTDIGGKVYELLKNNNENIFNNSDIKKMIEDVKKIEVDIENVEKKMVEIRTQKTTTGETKEEPTETSVPEKKIPKRAK